MWHLFKLPKYPKKKRKEISTHQPLTINLISSPIVITHRWLSTTKNRTQSKPDLLSNCDNSSLFQLRYQRGDKELNSKTMSLFSAACLGVLVSHRMGLGCPSQHATCHTFYQLQSKGLKCLTFTIIKDLGINLFLSGTNLSITDIVRN